jgi:hypothetical protein
MKTFNVGVINPVEEPIYAEHVDNEMLSLIRGQSRVEFNETAYINLRNKLQQTKLNKIGDPNPKTLQQITPLVQEQYGQGIRALILAEIITPTNSDDSYKISFMLFATKNAELLHETKIVVDNRYSLDSFSASTRMGINQMLQQIPFDGSVISREGYRVVVDRGKPYLKPGLQLPVYTIQLDNNTKVLEETGTIILTKVEENVSFGRVILEKKPLEVTVGNKLRLGGKIPEQWRLPGEEDMVDRSVKPQKRYGFVDLQLAGILMNLSNSTSTGSGLTTQNIFYPGGLFRGEVWITNAIFMEFGVNFATGSLQVPSGTGDLNLNSTLYDLRAQLGYRIFFSNEYGTAVHFRIGYGKQMFNIDVSPDPLLYTSNATSGLLISAGSKFPVSDRIGFGFDMSTLLFPSLTETPFLSGDTYSDLISWDMSLKAYYLFTPSLEISMRGIFQSLSCNFAGAGTRTIPLTNMNQNSKALMVGMTYYF